ncbi:hypothetical protein AMEX_G11798 [Astyanax mexicanus]|uniref:Uncharacterized protein n=1 Tax=Astyanax mexicanus TaxID=7994 RepID=A0A8T2LSR6_ASTMX|nr:hypothetical protein AMEX_G11798 [Astyanax mexicanus]
MMQQTFDIISFHFSEFSIADWNSWFCLRLVPLLPSLTPNMLQTILAKVDCTVYQIIVSGLSMAFDEMSLSLQKDITRILVNYLRETQKIIRAAKPCGSNTNTDFDWLWKNFGKFYIYMPLEDLQLLIPDLFKFSSINDFNASQVFDQAVTSNALQKKDLMIMVFNCLKKGNGLKTLQEFFSVLANSSKKKNLQIHPAVGDFMLNQTLDIITAHFPEFSNADWNDWFCIKLVPLFPSLTPETLKNILVNVNCTLYKIIVKGLNLGFEEMSLSLRQEITPPLVNYLKQTQKLKGSGTPCKSDTSNSNAWLLINFGKFYIHVNLDDLQLLNPDLIKNTTQVSYLNISSEALQNADMMKVVFDRLKEGNALKNVQEFLTALSNVSKTIQINPVVRDFMMNQTFGIISAQFSQFSRADWNDWFCIRLVPLLPSLTAEMLKTIVAKVDCGVYQIIVQGLNMAFENMPLSSQKDITLVLVNYLKQSQKLNGSGTPCKSDTNNSNAWLLINFGKFYIHVNLDDLQLLNPNLIKNTTQVSYLNITYDALQNADMMKVVFDRLKEGNALKNVQEFLTALSNVSKTIQINPVVRDFMMNQTFGIISAQFSQFSRADWNDWFCIRLVPLLPSLTAEMLKNIVAKVDCGVYQIIVQGLNMAFENMPLSSQKDITLVLVNYLKQSHKLNGSGTPCKSDTNNSNAWLLINFGKFYIHVNLDDLQLLNPDLIKNTTQVSYLNISTEALQNADMMKVVFDRLKEGNALKNVQEFLTVLSNVSKTIQINPAVRDFMMNQTFGIISAQFSQLSRADWNDWFCIRLVPLLPSLTAEMLKTIVAKVDCGVYQIIVQGLNMAFENMPLSSQKDITLVLVNYLKQSQKLNGSGTPCKSDTNNSNAWLLINFGKFYIHANLVDLQLLNPDLIKNTTQVSYLNITYDALQNADMMKVVFDRLKEGNALKNVQDFLSALSYVSKTIQINPVVRDFMMNQTFGIISAQFSQFSRADWNDWFCIRLVPLLPSLTAEMLKTIVAKVDCGVYQIIVQGLNMAFENMPLSSQKDITLVLVNYLKQSQKLSGSGTPCKSDTNNSNAWLLINFGKFYIHVNLDDLQLLNPDLIKNTTQVSYLNISSEALQNADMMKVVFDRLKEGNALKNVKEFLTALSNVSKTIQINPAVRDFMMNQTFGIISAQFSQFSRADWNDWFCIRLVPLLPSLTAEMLKTIVAKVDCGVYQIIVQGLNMAFENMPLSSQKDITLVLVNYLKQSQKLNGSGTPCKSDTNNSNAWLLINFGKFYIHANLVDLQLLNPDLIKNTTQVSYLNITYDALQNADMMKVVFDRLKEGNALKNVQDFLTALSYVSKTIQINPVVRDFMMKQTFGIISAQFSQFSRADWNDWFCIRLVPLLPSLTGEMLKTIVAKVDCGVYQIIVKGLNMAFENMPLSSQKNITLVLLNYLKNSWKLSGSDSRCGSDTSTSTDWLLANFGKYCVHVSLEDLQSINPEFSKESQVYYLNISGSGSSQNTDMIKAVFDQIKEGNALTNLQQFLGAFANSSKTVQLQPALTDLMMNQTFGIISSYFSSFSRAEWDDWFCVKLVPLFPSLTSEMLKTILAKVDCSTYQIIVKGLDMAFDKMSLSKQKDITLVLMNYMKQEKKVSGSGLPCRSDTNTSTAWLLVNFGKFSIHASSDDLQSLSPDFSKVPSLGLYNVSQVYYLNMSSEALQNTDAIKVVFDRLKEGDALKNLQAFLAALANSSKTLQSQPLARDFIMNQTFGIISSRFSNFSRADWNDWFCSKLVPLLPSLTGNMLKSTLTKVDCGVYQIIVKGLNMTYENMSGSKQKEITLALVNYLKDMQKINSSGIPCSSTTNTYTDWVLANFGKYSTSVSQEDLQLLNKGFFKMT